VTVPTVSVVLPVRDGALHLPEALESLRAQTFRDFELIVVDDGSRDDSAAIAEAHGARVLRQGREGLVAALERGRAAARGRFLARMDADDVALPERLELQVAALDEEGLDACGGGIEYFPKATEGAERYARWLNGLVTPEAAARDVFVECPLPHPALMARRELVEYRDCGWPEDYDLVLRLWARGGRFRNVEQVVLRWRDRPDRLSRTDPRYSQDAFVRCKVHHLRETLLRGRPGAVVWGAGPVGKSFGRELGGDLVAFVEVDPRKLGKRIYGVPVVPVDEAPRFAEALWLGAVAGEESRGRIREEVAAHGRREGLDFVAVA
jgi:glycosyltransferase involved in cell wall biosynthesis